jgi:hypothetical protein
MATFVGPTDYDKHLFHCTQTFANHLRDIFDIDQFTVKYKSRLANKRARYSYGGYDTVKFGGSYVNFVVNNIFANTHTPWVFKEYPRFNKDPIIGGFKGNWQKYFAALAAHEVAHGFQYNPLARKKLHRNNYNIFPYFDNLNEFDVVNYHDKKLSLNNHNEFFRDVYAILRSEFVNQL